MGNRQRICLGEITRKIGSGATPTGGKESYKDSGIPLIRSQNIYNNGFSFPGLAFIDDSQAEKLNNVIVEANDVLLNITGDSIARSCQAPSRILPARVNQHVAIIRPNTDILFPRYLRFVMVSQEIQEIMLSMASSGATRDALTKEMIGRITIPVPPLPTQKTIAHILGTLDDKIELLRSMNETLEAMARALFKSWFIDFDPVRKKAEGQPTGLPPDIDALLPDSFEDSELGEIPKGWSITTLDKIASLETKSIAPYEHPERCFVHYSIPAFDTNGMPNKEYGLSIKSNKYVVRHNAVLLSKLNPETPRIWIPIDTGKDSICSTEFMQFVPRGEIQKYLYLLLGSDSFYEELLKRVTGSTGSRQRAQPSQIAVLPIIKPPQPIVERFEQLASPIIDSANGNKVETSSLTLIRDSLLPKLISGEIELSDKEISKIMEPAK